MRYWTWEEIKEKIEAECDLEDESFVRPKELLSYANEAIDEAEAEIIGLYQDYMLTYKDYPVVAGALDAENSGYLTLPENIYANKIRKIIYYQGYVGNTTFWVVNRLKESTKFLAKASGEALNQSTRVYEYMIVNRAAGDVRVEFTPTIQESGVMRVWYLRNANRLVELTDICDIPEFTSFVIAYIKTKVYEKEGHPLLGDASARLEKARAQMVGTLQEMVPDAENQIEADFESYEEMN